MMVTSNIHTAIAWALRTAIELRRGDRVPRVTEDRRAVAKYFDGHSVADDPVAIFSEWHSADDTDAYAKL